jgi:transcriptional regulator with XRE-family HTH domain
MSTIVAPESQEIGARIRSERVRLGLNQADFAASCLVSKTSQVNYESGLRSPDAIYLRHAQTIGVDTSYVVTGSRVQDKSSQSDFVSIPMLGITASAGNGQVNDVQGEYVVQGLAFSAQWLQRRQLNPDYLRVIEVRGASMSGVLSDGDRVLIDLSDTRAKSGYVYVIRQGDELLVKYCQLLPGGILRVSSANPQYATYDVELDRTPDLAIIGRVVASMHEW